MREWEADDGQTEIREPKTLESAWKEFISDLEARKLHDSTVRKYKLLDRQMKEFASRRGLRFLPEFDLPAVSQFRSEWKDGPRSSAKKLEQLRAFFRFAQKRKWNADNPASDLKSPKVTLCPTLPFSREEMIRILAAVDKYKDEMPKHGIENARRMRGLVLLLRYSGMRVGDGVNLTDTNYFWSGRGNLESVVRSWQTRLRRLFELANVPNGHPHRFRDTFAVELLLAGVPIERVSILLGHQSVRITERHYNPWNKARQDQLEADLARAWERDPLLLSQTEGTRGVHGKPRRVN